ncbi:MAG: hypothetical protein AAFX03_02120 [Pseudomonadota bacterium]
MAHARWTLGGLALASVGALDILARSRAEDPFAGAWCLSSGAAAADPLVWLGHCWGCYAIVAGAAIALASLARRRRSGGFPGLR